MNLLEKLRIEILQDKNNASLDEILNQKIEEAKMFFLVLKYPYDCNKEHTDIPKRYDYWLVLCAKELYNKFGTEGLLSYSENGLSISYDQASSIVSPSLCCKIIPSAGVPK